MVAAVGLSAMAANLLGPGFAHGLAVTLMFLARYAHQDVEVLERRTRRELCEWADAISDFLKKEFPQ